MTKLFGFGTDCLAANFQSANSNGLASSAAPVTGYLGWGFVAKLLPFLHQIFFNGNAKQMGLWLNNYASIEYRPREGASVRNDPIVLCKNKDAVMRLCEQSSRWCFLILGLCWKELLTWFLPYTHKKKNYGSLAWWAMVHFKSSLWTGLWIFIPGREAPSLCTSGGVLRTRHPLPSKQPSLCLFKDKCVSVPGDSCRFCGLISGGQVHLFGALVYFSSASVIPAYFSLNSVCRPPLLSAAASVCGW